MTTVRVGDIWASGVPNDYSYCKHHITAVGDSKVLVYEHPFPHEKNSIESEANIQFLIDHCISGNNKPWIDPKTNQPRYFNSLKLGHISSVKGEQTAPAIPQQTASAIEPLSQAVPSIPSMDDSDIPF